MRQQINWDVAKVACIIKATVALDSSANAVAERSQILSLDDGLHMHHCKAWVAPRRLRAATSWLMHMSFSDGTPRQGIANAIGMICSTPAAADSFTS